MTDLEENKTEQIPEESPKVVNPFPRIRLYLVPVLSTASRRSLDVMETYWRQGKLTVTNGTYWTLAIIRSAIDLHEQDSDRVRQGLTFLIREVLHSSPLDLLKALKNNVILRQFGIVRLNEKPIVILTSVTNCLKNLELPLASPTTAAHTPKQQTT